MEEPYFWYVMYVRTNTENRVIEDIDRFIEKSGFDYEFEPFCPVAEFYYRNKDARRPGKVYRKRPLFPGYVFIETNMPAKEFVREFATYIYGSNDIIRLLRSGSPDSIALPKDERQRLEYLLKGKRCLERSVGYIVGDKVTVESGPLVGKEGLITYINRHNRFADIELDMFGGKIKARVALEIVSKN